MWERVYVVIVCVSLPSEATALNPGPELGGEDVPEWLTGLGEDSQKTLAIPQRPRKLCASAGSWACPHSSCHVGLAYVTCPWIPHSKRLNPSLARREARPALGLALSLALSPPWPLRLPAPSWGNRSCRSSWQTHRLLSGQGERGPRTRPTVLAGETEKERLRARQTGH